jgi:hypothetical protein
MTDRPPPADHHLAAARHHHQAARHYREAGRHFQVGKDFEHAAHQALLAQGHAGHARAEEILALQYYHDQGVPPPLGTDQDIPRVTDENYAAAAHHHEQAAHHHGHAVRFNERHDHSQAALETYYAQSHGRHSAFFGAEAAMLHSEHSGKSGPSGEIA